MSNDERSTNDEVRIKKAAYLQVIGHSDFVILSSLVIRHSSFLAIFLGLRFLIFQRRPQFQDTSRKDVLAGFERLTRLHRLRLFLGGQFLFLGREATADEGGLLETVRDLDPPHGVA